MTVEDIVNYGKYCVGHKRVKLCDMCLNKKVLVALDKLEKGESKAIKMQLRKLSPDLCKNTNASYYESKVKI